MCSPVCAMGRARASRLLAALCWLLLCAPWLAACGTTERPPLRVVATIAPLADWARQVGQRHVSVTLLVPAGVDPQSYVLSAADQRALKDADVLIFNGLDLEPWLSAAVDQLKPEHMVSLELAQFVGATSSAQSSAGRAPLEPDSEGSEALRQNRTTILAQPTYSPYLWLDPGPDMAQRSVTLIADTLARADPDRLLVYRRNAEQYNGELENLDSWVRRQIRSWPRVTVGARKLLAWQSLDRSWYYFAARYGISLRTVESLRSIEPPLPDSTPLVVDRLRYQTSLTSDRRPPDAVLNALGDESYIPLMRRNVSLMTQGMQQAARNASASSQPPETP